MKNLVTIARGLDVMPLALALRQHRELWNQHKLRTEYEESPHREVDDIWVRYNGRLLEGGAGLKSLSDEHDSVWYPSYQLLPQVRDLVMPLMARVQGTRLGGILITRIAPGCQVYPHVDGGWHATYYQKYAVQLESAPGQSFNYDDGFDEAAPGDVYWFNNQASHWVINRSDTDRVTMIVCIKS